MTRREFLLCSVLPIGSVKPRAAPGGSRSEPALRTAPLPAERGAAPPPALTRYAPVHGLGEWTRD
jgi:hypothetical protein